MSSDQPRNVYRYQGFSSLTLQMLCRDRLYFADPADFNDPLDCQPTVEADSDRYTLRQLVTEFVKRRTVAETLAALKNARLEGEKAKAHAARLGEQAARDVLANIGYKATDPMYEEEGGLSEKEAERWLLVQEIERELLRQYDRGVCCFSTLVDNPLLWSHYGDQHQGLCVGYGLDRIPKPRLERVVYDGDRTVKTSLIAEAIIDNDPKARTLLDRDVLLRKADPWRYEREWRLLGDRGDQDSPLLLKDVTFGLRCPAAIQYAVIRALESRGRPIEFFEMKEKDRGSFELERQPVETGEMFAYFPRTARSGIEIFGPPKDEP
uniref:DUF2971 domain-containing protein n=1 Tax=Candidatus Kentrum sp. LPFa TaxID=2126335 RepID=A0A450WJ59_9GAMM|nr:MAG: Protein of unknown function (DUF2971) [Candidatus Kentron sp. LPFa]VFK32392.1 MAG: Protein of unknown function (DUF2971) [Candidatus Kentron sp. LPFa]